MLGLGLRLRFGSDWIGYRGRGLVRRERIRFFFSFLCLGGGRKGLMFYSALMVVVVCGVWWRWGMGWGGMG